MSTVCLIVSCQSSRCGVSGWEEWASHIAVGQRWYQPATTLGSGGTQSPSFLQRNLTDENETMRICWVLHPCWKGAKGIILFPIQDWWFQLRLAPFVWRTVADLHSGTILNFSFTLKRNIAKALRCLRIRPMSAAYRRRIPQMATIASATNYEGWSSEQLINRIKELETRLSNPATTPSKPKK